MDNNTSKTKKKPDLNSKAAKYFRGHTSGMTKQKALLAAGFSPKSINNYTNIERTKRYQEIQEYYKDALLNNISVQEIAEEHVKNIKQDQDRGAKNKAIEMALKKIEPDATPDDGHEMIFVKLK